MNNAIVKTASALVVTGLFATGCTRRGPSFSAPEKADPVTTTTKPSLPSTVIDFVNQGKLIGGLQRLTTLDDGTQVAFYPTALFFFNPATYKHHVLIGLDYEFYLRNNGIVTFGDETSDKVSVPDKANTYAIHFDYGVIREHLNMKKHMWEMCAQSTTLKPLELDFGALCIDGFAIPEANGRASK